MSQSDGFVLARAMRTFSRAAATAASSSSSSSRSLATARRMKSDRPRDPALFVTRAIISGSSRIVVMVWSGSFRPMNGSVREIARAVNFLALLYVKTLPVYGRLCYKLSRSVLTCEAFP